MMGVSGLLLSYTWALGSNTFYFILLPEWRPVQKTQDPIKRANLNGLRTWQTLISVLSLNNICKEISFSPSDKDPGGNPAPALTREGVHWATAQLPPAPLGRRIIRVHRGLVGPRFRGDSVPAISGTLGFWSSLWWEIGVPPFPMSSVSYAQILPRVVYITGSGKASSSSPTVTQSFIATQSPLKCAHLHTPLEGVVGHALCLVQEKGDWI